MGKTMEMDGRGEHGAKILGVTVTDRSVKTVAKMLGGKGKGKRDAWTYIENIEWVQVQVQTKDSRLRSMGSIVVISGP